MPRITFSTPNRLRIYNGVKRLAQTVSPGLYRHVELTYSTRRDRFEQEVLKTLNARLNWTVASGPFQGMRYTNYSYQSRLLPKLAGSYEAQLHPVLEQVISQAPQRIADVGCAEGYYAVGLARRLPSATVFAFDISAQARDACSALAAHNQVDTVFVRGACTPATLSTLNASVIICDCEGYEAELLDSKAASALSKLTMIVELHEFIDDAVLARLSARFSGTHKIEVFTDSPRDVDAIPVLAGLSPRAKAVAVDEDRHYDGLRINQRWAVLSPTL